MDIDMGDFLEAVAEQASAAPLADAPGDYLHQRGVIIGAALRGVAAGAHPADVLEEMEERLAEAARPVMALAPPEWRRQQLTAAP